MADDKNPKSDPAVGPGNPGTGTGTATPAFVEIVLPRPGTTIPPLTAQVRIEIFSTQPALPHYVQFFLDVPHVPNTMPGQAPTDVIPGTNQAQVTFNEPAYPNIGTAFLIPPPQPVGTAQPNYLLTCWVGNDINLRYTGQPIVNQMPERVLQIVTPTTTPPNPPGPPTGPGNSPPPPTGPTI